MNEIKSCIFDDDNLIVKVVFTDNKELTILVVQIEESLDSPLIAQSKFDWLLYNEPSTFAKLVISDKLEEFITDYSKSYIEQENTIRNQLESSYFSEDASQIAKEFMMYKN